MHKQEHTMHYKMVHMEYKYKCFVCNEQFMITEEFIKHIRFEHREKQVKIKPSKVKFKFKGQEPEPEKPDEVIDLTLDDSD